MALWENYLDTLDGRPHTVVGDIRICRDVSSPQLGNARDIVIYLPPSYEKVERRYPVLYLHDGQNVFDRYTSFVGEWEADESLERLSAQGLDLIAVGIPNMGVKRIYEYSPFRSRGGEGGGGDRYLDFIVDTVKPMIDRDFRTLPDRTYTGLLGSSMGGLISLYAFFRRPEVFGFAGVMSPSIGFADRAILSYIKSSPRPDGRIYMDMGVLEGLPERRRKRIMAWLLRRGAIYDARRCYQLLRRKGMQPGWDLRYLEDPEGIHNEVCWARRFPDAVRHFLRDDER